MPYSKLAPREYRKLHNVHTNVQKDKADISMRLPKQKPQFSYASGNEPDLPFLRKHNANDVSYSGDSAGEEDFPSPSALLRGEYNIADLFESGNVSYKNTTPTSSLQDDSLESLEDGMRGLDETVIVRPPTPKINSNFANGFFDFEAFEEMHGEPARYSSPLMRESRKRERSLSPVSPGFKHRQIPKEGPKTSPPFRELSSTLELPEVECRKVKKKELGGKSTEKNSQQSTQQRAVPAWVDEFDADLIESLMDVVDFVD
jgi:ATP-dependent DNA helicase HFM1/MER3